MIEPLPLHAPEGDILDQDDSLGRLAVSAIKQACGPASARVVAKRLKAARSAAGGTILRQAEYELITQFVQRVNARAEAEMLTGKPMTGAHHRALEEEHAMMRLAYCGGRDHDDPPVDPQP